MVITFYCGFMESYIKYQISTPKHVGAIVILM